MSITKTQHHEALRGWLVDWLAHYPEDIFAPPPEFTAERDELLSTVVAAHMGRHVLRRVIEHIDADGLPTRGRERLPNKVAEPDAETLKWVIDRWDMWATSLLGVSVDVRATGRVHMRTAITKLVDDGRATARPAPRELPHPWVTDPIHTNRAITEGVEVTIFDDGVRVDADVPTTVPLAVIDWLRGAEPRLRSPAWADRDALLAAVCRSAGLETCGACHGLADTLLTEVERLRTKLAAAQHSLVQAGTEHARDRKHLADRTAELAERTRERDDALMEAACRLRDDDSWDGFQVRVLDLASKWHEQSKGDGKRSAVLGGCARELLELAKAYPEEPSP